MTDKNELETDLEAALQEWMPGQGPADAKLVVETILAYLETVELSNDEKENTTALARIRKILSTMIYSNSLLPIHVLDMISKVQKQETLQMLLHCLPVLTENQEIDSASEPIVSVLLDTWHRAPTARLPILVCLSVLPLTGEARKASFQQAFKSLPLVDESEWPLLIRILLRGVSEKGEAMMLWSTIRAQCKDIIEMTDHFMLAAQFIFDEFRQDQKHALFITTFLHCVRESEEALNALDIVLLLGLSKEYEDPIDKILDSWLTRQCFPFSLCETLLERMFSSNRLQLQSSLYQRTVEGLLRLAVFLLLAPVRLPNCELQPVVVLVLQMVNVFDHEHQESLLSSLVHLSEEVDGLSIENTEETKQPRDLLPFVFQPVYDVLRIIAQETPHLLVPFKWAFMRRLSCDSWAHNPTVSSSVEDICSILVAVGEASLGGYQEIMDLLQRLLFLSTGGYSLSSDDSTQVVRGLVLAKTLVSSSAASDSEIEQIKAWVQTIMLPSTRRTIAPEVGRASLLFLNVLANRDASSCTATAYFDQFKMVLANTGLIQKLSQYKGARNRTAAIFAYQEVPPELASYTSAQQDVHVSPQDIIFCVDYFLRRNNVTDPTRWECTCLWVFELVDTYLTLARNNGKKDWTAEGWLQASIEFSSFSFPSVSSAVDAALADVNDYSLYSHVEEIESAQVEGEFTQDFVQVLCQHETALLVGISLSLAVLKNASEHFFTPASAPEQSQSRQWLLLYQMLKLFHLKSKSRKVLSLLRVLKISSKRKRQDIGKSFKLNRQRKDSSGDEHELQTIVPADAIMLSSFVERASREIDKIHMLLFSGSYLSSNILWRVLQEYYVDNALLKVLQRKVVARDHCRPFDLAMATFQCTFMDELALVPKRLTLSSSHDAKLSALGLIRSMRTVVDYYIQFLQRNLDDFIDSQVYDITIQLARGYCKLVSIILTDSELLVESIPDQQDEVISELMVPCTSREEVEGEPITADFLELVSSQLKNVEDVGIAHFQLDILACLATRTHIRYLDKVIESSWFSLHAVFSGSIELVSDDWDRNLSRILQRQQTKRTSDVRIRLNTILEAIVLSSRAISVNNCAPYCLAVIRHVSLISYTVDRFWRFSNHIIKLVEETESLAVSLHSAIRGGKVEIDGKQSTSRAIPAPSFPFLNSTTLPDFFQTLLSMITLMAGCMDPALTTVCSKHEGPYRHLKFTLGVFRRLLNTFREHFAIFPTRTTRIVSSISRDLVEVMTLQLRRCVDWRNRQPILAVAQRTTAIDVGSLSYLDELIHVHISPVVGDASCLCDFFVERSDGPYFPFKRTNIRAAVEKMGREIRKVAATHNLSTPTFLPQKLPKLDDFMTANAESRTLDSNDGGVTVPLSKTTRSDEDASSCMSGSDADSFGVSGEWGTSDDESSKGFDNQPTSLIKRS